MDFDNFSAEIEELVRVYIDSLEELEILLLLRADPAKEWSDEDVNASIRSSITSVGARLKKLKASGFLVESTDGRFRFLPRDEKSQRAAELLADGYRERRRKVIEMIFTKPIQSIRSFSDAFLIRGKKNDG